MAQERLNEIRQNRLDKRQAMIAEKIVPYPSEAQRTHTISAALESYDQLAQEQTMITVTGRIMALRRHGGIAFIDLQDFSGTLQLQVSQSDLPADIFERLDRLDVGDFLQAAGRLSTTARGVQTQLVVEFHLLAKSIRPMPSAWHGLKDHETRFRNREMDLLLNPAGRQIMLLREKIITWLRQHLRAEGYIEFETPILQAIPGGAAARPFTTHHHALDIPLYLRISAELSLKRLLAAGFEKVFEIERRFRNEGLSRQHNPEFTMLEAQWAYADYEDLMTHMESMLENMCRDLLGSADITWQAHKLDLASPFNRLRYVDVVSDKLGVDILVEKNPAVYWKLLQQEGIAIPPTENYYHLVDELYKKLIRPTIIQPTFLYDYPAEMAPLAKRSSTDSRLAEKFQLIIGGMEVNNSYTEQNDPVIQRQIMQEQHKQNEAGDLEAQPIDEEYLRVMEYGMPPNVGWGIGVDRLVMILGNVPSIRDTMAFPLMKPKTND